MNNPSQKDNEPAMAAMKPREKRMEEDESKRSDSKGVYRLDSSGKAVLENPKDIYRNTGASMTKSEMRNMRKGKR